VSLQVAEAALADEWVRNGDRLALQRRVLRLGKPPRRWKRPQWAAAAMREPREVRMPRAKPPPPTPPTPARIPICASSAQMMTPSTVFTPQAIAARGSRYNLVAAAPQVRIVGRPINCTAGVKSRFWGHDGQQCSVEELALQHYASDEGGGWLGERESELCPSLRAASHPSATASFTVRWTKHAVRALHGTRHVAPRTLPTPGLHPLDARMLMMPGAVAAGRAVTRK
jgi:hypothetical protein